MDSRLHIGSRERTALRYAAAMLLWAACVFVTDAEIESHRDRDQDGVRGRAFGGDDCDDDDGTVGSPSTWYADEDGDGAGAGDGVEACEAPADHVAEAGDCDDTDPTVQIAERSDYYADADADGYGAGTAATACRAPEGYVSAGGDCDDADQGVHPDAVETCDGVDGDCDGGEPECEVLAMIHDGSPGVGGFGRALGSARTTSKKRTVIIGEPASGSVWWDTLGDAPEAAGSLVLSESAEFGASVAAGEFYDLGEEEFLVGAPGSGEVFVYDGDDLSLPIGSYRMTGREDERFGAALQVAEDQGRPYVVIGAPLAQAGRGEVFFVAGGIPGAVDLENHDTDIDDCRLSIEGVDDEDDGAGVGSAVVPVDHDGDGRPGLVIGAPGRDDGAGRVYFAAGPIATGNNLNEPGVVRFDGQAGDAAGAALSVGERDGDGEFDLAVGAPESRGDDERGGAVYLLSLDGAEDGGLAAADIVIYGPIGSATGAALAFADLDGDDRMELAIGAPDWTTAAGVQGGAVFVVPGNLAPGTYLLADTGAEVYGCEDPGCEAGVALHADDFDGDGADDVAIGAPGLTETGMNTGAVGFLLGTP